MQEGWAGFRQPSPLSDLLKDQLVSEIDSCES